MDLSPDSVFGLACAIGGTLLILAAWVGYVIRRVGAVRRGRLQSWQTWHAVAGTLGLALVLTHAGGNLNVRTGTYALAGVLALVISGVVGRILDGYAKRWLARLPVGAPATRRALAGELARVWRRLHVLLAGAALGLIAWHIWVAIGLLWLLR